jgi:DNA-binding transcriptional MocR family regulator
VHIAPDDVVVTCDIQQALDLVGRHARLVYVTASHQLPTGA